MSSFTLYDARTLQGYVDELYRKAALEPTSMAIIYGILTFFASSLLYVTLHFLRGQPGDTYSRVFSVGGSTIWAIRFGIGVGRQKALRMRIAGQQALCQVEIEQRLSKASASP